MAISSINASFDCDLSHVWNMVTSLENYQWRSDLSKIEVLSDIQFVEYTKDGYATTFTVTACEPCIRWEFDMENSNMKGHWIGIFSEKNGRCEIEFTEDVTAKKFFIKPFVGAFLKKQQAQYVADLRKAVDNV
ncbi:MAG: SRPBCC family protein [Lachnospiraceae bacterium]|nr:SRPBCC family protein [Lachnospiraceae bacterium]